MEEPKECDCPCRHLRAMPSGPRLRLLGGLTASMHQIVAAETGP